MILFKVNMLDSRWQASEKTHSNIGRQAVVIALHARSSVATYLPQCYSRCACFHFLDKCGWVERIRSSLF